MGRTRGWAAARRMKPFLALLKRSDHLAAPPLRLVAMAGRLCRGLRRSPRALKKLVEAMGQGRHWGRLLASLPVVQAGVTVHLQEKDYSAACQLLESSTAMEKEELVKLWNEIHYRQAMDKHQAWSLTPVQRYRCRKRNPPPASLCPERAKSRYYSQDVREILRRFAVEVTTHPSKKQREIQNFLGRGKATVRASLEDRPSPLNGGEGTTAWSIFPSPPRGKAREGPEVLQKEETPTRAFRVTLMFCPNGGAAKPQEGLACETNLEPHRIYNWFANYRRRQGRKPKSREPGFPLGFEDKAASPRGCPGARVWQDGPATGQQERVEWRERPFPTCKRERRGHGHLSEGGFLRPTSLGQSEELGAPGPSAISVGPLETIWESAAPNAGQAEAKLEADPKAVWDPAGPWPPSLGAQKPLRPPSSSSETDRSSQSLPPDPWTRPGTAHKGIQCTLWSQAVSCRCPCSCSQRSFDAGEGGAAATGTGAAYGERPPGLLAGGPPRTVRERGDFEIEGLVMRRQEQLVASWAALVASQPFSSSQGDADQAHLHPAISQPCPEGSPALASEQLRTFPREEVPGLPSEPAVVLREAKRGRLAEEAEGEGPSSALCRGTFQELRDPESQPSFSDTLWAASLLCEFSSGSRP